jgi:ornithine cyclodeaminase
MTETQSPTSENSPAAGPLYFGRDAVARDLGFPACIDAVRQAMIALSSGETLQLPRAMIGMGEQRTYGLMAGALGTRSYFGSKLVAVFADPTQPGRTRHEGLVVVFDGENGDLVCTLDAGAVTQIRTAAATAVATAALARPDAEVLALIGCGHQAHAHVEAIAHARKLRRVIVWGRSPDRAAAFAADTHQRLGLTVEIAPDVRTAVADADIICTLTGAKTPILHGDWVNPGAHVNLVGSSGPGPVEADEALVLRGRYFVESRENARLAASEFLLAKASGAIDDRHIAAEIGEVLAGSSAGRTSPDEITIYKSLGHVVQDLAAAKYLYERHLAGRAR